MNKKFAALIAGFSILLITGIWIVKFKIGQKGVIIKENGESTMEETSTVRQPAVSQAFYPADPVELKNKISGFLSSTNKQIGNDQMVKLLIVPHAGYDYSGMVASTGFKEIENQEYDKVILLGSSHQHYFKGVVIDENTVWKTPLGQVPIDLITAQGIVDSSESFHFSTRAHADEHTLEVELPFLQTVLGEFKIVPILLGQTTDEDINQLANAIFNHLTPTTLIVVSTDLSHYPNYEIANSIDERTINSILTGDPVKFDQKLAEQRLQNYPNVETLVCAENAVKTGMKVVEKISREGNWTLLKYANSGDTAGEKSRVVGYAAMAFSQKKSNLQSSNVQKGLKKDEKDKLLDIARETLESYIRSGEKPGFMIEDAGLQSKQGVFVTLTKNGELRGCMGEFNPETPIWQTVIDQTVIAASEDPRFPPVLTEELDQLQIEISLLSEPRAVGSWQEIELGKHGVIVRKGSQSGTYLPQVGKEQDWQNVEEFLASLCQEKAGLPIDCYKDRETELLVYTADLFSENEEE